MSDKIAGNLRFLRSTRVPEYSQREIAQKLHISRSAYSRYENGTFIPPLWFLRQAAAFYGISIDTLVNEDMIRSEKSKNENITQKDESANPGGEVKDHR